MKVQTHVEFDVKEIQDIMVEHARKQVQAASGEKPVGGSVVTFSFDDSEKSKLTGASVSFTVSKSAT